MSGLQRSEFRGFYACFAHRACVHLRSLGKSRLHPHCDHSHPTRHLSACASLLRQHLLTTGPGSSKIFYGSSPMKKFVVVSAIFCLGSTVYAQEMTPAATPSAPPTHEAR